MPYCDVHIHLIHEKFSVDLDDVIDRASNAGVKGIVNNGLNPKSNDHVLQISRNYPAVIPACGIYPSDAVNQLLGDSLPFRVDRFSVNEEIARIRSFAANGLIKAVGECGLDGHWLDSNTDSEQERVFIELLSIAKEYKIPAIIHSRKKEKRVLEILAHYKIEKADLHCFGGKTNLAVKYAESYGWSFSIPANSRANEHFASMLCKLPLECILTETDAPYLSPSKGARNEPVNVIGTIHHLAELRKIDPESARDKVWKNFEALFS